ncbi:MAG: 30S ribosomal protein S4e [archaeon]|nr:30S ribosomal protein S4e [archaeon]
MALRGGGQRKQKRISASKVRHLHRKEFTWTIKNHPGPHNDNQSVPLGFILRDLLKFASTLKEAKRILNESKVSVDGKIRKDYKFPVGLFDVITIKEDEKKSIAFITLLDHKGRIIMKATEAKHLTKIVKITAKKIVKKGRIQLTTNDGRTFMQKDSKNKVGDSLQIELPSQKILKELEFKHGNTALIVGGKNVGKVAVIKEISEGTMQRTKTITLDAKGKQFKTTHNHVFVIGEKTPLIEVM